VAHLNNPSDKTTEPSWQTVGVVRAGGWHEVDWKRNETLVFLVVVAFCILTHGRDPAFFRCLSALRPVRNVVLGIFGSAFLWYWFPGRNRRHFTAICRLFRCTSTTLIW